MPEKKNINILIVDDHWIFRKSLKSLLESKSGLNIIGEAENGKVAIQKAKLTRPDVVLMDVRMPVLVGLGATRQIKKWRPETIIIAIS